VRRELLDQLMRVLFFASQIVRHAYSIEDPCSIHDNQRSATANDNPRQTRGGSIVIHQ
jgi:hypothetical protein